MSKVKHLGFKNMLPVFAISMGLVQIVPDLFSYELTNYEIKYILISILMYTAYSVLKTKNFFNILVAKNLISDRSPNPLSEINAMSLTIIVIVCLSFIFKLELSRIFIGVVFSIFILFAFVDKIKVPALKEE
jgi:hypothetical protein